MWSIEMDAVESKLGTRMRVVLEYGRRGRGCGARSSGEPAGRQGDSGM